MGKNLLQILFISAALIIVTGYSSTAMGATGEAPFHNGEKIGLQVTWSRILAGEASIELTSSKDLNGEEAFHILMKVRTSDFVDIFYKVRDTMESYIDTGVTRSLGYSKKHQAKSKREINVDFNWNTMQATYISNGEKRKPISIMPGTFDPLSVFFAFRMHDLENEPEFTVPVTDGKKMSVGKANVIKKETIKVAGVKYDTFLVEPDMEEIGGVFEKSKDAKLQIWVTADRRHIPVRIKSKVAVGSFVVELTSYEEGDVKTEGINR